jgi:hypothetical protein
LISVLVSMAQRADALHTQCRHVDSSVRDTTIRLRDGGCGAARRLLQFVIAAPAAGAGKAKRDNGAPI